MTEDIQKLGRMAGARLGEPIMRTVDRNLTELAAKVEEYIDAERRTRNMLRIREAELLELKGPCPTCRLHAGHVGPCAPWRG